MARGDLRRAGLTGPPDAGTPGCALAGQAAPTRLHTGPGGFKFPAVTLVPADASGQARFPLATSWPPAGRARGGAAGPAVVTEVTSRSPRRCGRAVWSVLLPSCSGGVSVGCRRGGVGWRAPGRRTQRSCSLRPVSQAGGHVAPVHATQRVFGQGQSWRGGARPGNRRPPRAAVRVARRPCRLPGVAGPDRAPPGGCRRQVGGGCGGAGDGATPPGSRPLVWDPRRGPGPHLPSSFAADTALAVRERSPPPPITPTASWA